MADADDRSAMQPIADAAVILRNPLIVAADANGETMMMRIDQERYFLLDDIGGDIWQRLATPCSFVELVESLAADYAGDSETIRTDLCALLRRMAADDIIILG
jgi:hypothetical protein